MIIHKVTHAFNLREHRHRNLSRGRTLPSRPDVPLSRPASEANTTFDDHSSRHTITREVSTQLAEPFHPVPHRRKGHALVPTPTPQLQRYYMPAQSSRCLSCSDERQALPSQKQQMQLNAHQGLRTRREPMLRLHVMLCEKPVIGRTRVRKTVA